MARTQISLDTDVHRRARQRANDLGMSLAEYVRRLVARDLDRPRTDANPALVFDLGSSKRSEVAQNKDPMIAEAFASSRDDKRRRRPE